MKVVVVLADGFEDSEAIVTQDVVKRGGIDVVLAGLSKKIIESSRGVKVITNELFSSDAARRYDGIVLPGGRGYRYLLQSSTVGTVLKEFNKSKKLIAAICAAPVVLAENGILDDVKATVYPGFEKKIPHPRDGDVIVDGNVITARGPGAAFKFGLKIVEYLSGAQVAKRVKNEMVIQ